MSAEVDEIRMDLSTCNAVYDDFMFSEARHFGMLGGAGSGKSYACADKVIMTAIAQGGHRIGVFRKVGATVMDSVFALIEERIDHWGMRDLLDGEPNKTLHTFKFKNGSKIWCKGLDDQAKIKSIVGLSMVWAEEATDFTPEDLKQFNLRMRGNTPGYKQIIYSFNGISRRHHLKKNCSTRPRETAKQSLQRIKTTASSMTNTLKSCWTWRKTIQTLRPCMLTAGGVY